MGRKSLVFSFLVIILVLIIGTIGYVLLGWKWLDALYMTVITVSSVGYKEVHYLPP